MTKRISFIFAALFTGMLLVLVLWATNGWADEQVQRGVPHQTLLLTNEAQLQVGIAGVGMSDLAGGYLSPITVADQPFTHMLLRWEATGPVSDTLALEVRASFDGVAWTDWGPVTENPDLWVPEDGPEVFWSQDIYAGEGLSFWQVRARITPDVDGQVPVLRQVEVNTIDARFGPTDPLPEAALQVAPASGLPRPQVVSRTAWGSPDGQGSRVPPAYRNVTHMVVHHTADANSLGGSQQRWSDRVRAIWSFHTFTRGWGDIGYNYLIDPNGVVYEGRAGGDDAVAFHDTANFGSMGVVLIGTYSTVDPQPAAINSLVDLLAWKAAQKRIDPFAQAFYQGCASSQFCNPFNAGAIVPTIAGHRHVTPNRTTCPGDRLVALLPGVRQRVAERLATGYVPPPPPPPALELLDVRYDRTEIAVGDLLQVVFTVRNASTAPILSQAPEAAQGPDGYDRSQGYVYDEGECFLGAAGQVYPAFAKEADRFRVMLGVSGRTLTCAGDTGGFPWRWGLNGPLAPGETREIIGYVRFREPGTLTVRPGAIHEYVGYLPTELPAQTITITPERQPPALATYDAQLRPLAHVYALRPMPDTFLARTTNPLSIQTGAYLGNFVWYGERQHWGQGGPLEGLSDNFVIEQTRVFVAPSAGLYRFQLTSDDGAWLWINGQLVVQNPGLRDERTVVGERWLPAGRHVLSFKYFERTGDAVAGYAIQMPDQPIFGLVNNGLLGNGTQIERGFGTAFTRLGGITLVADDLGGSGVDRLRFSWNGLDWFDAPGGMIDLGGLMDGSYTLYYQALDRAGNASAQHQISLTVNSSMVVEQIFLPLVQ
jgi:hypothetical protein